MIRTSMEIFADFDGVGVTMFGDATRIDAPFALSTPSARKHYAISRYHHQQPLARVIRLHHHRAISRRQHREIPAHGRASVTMARLPEASAVCRN